MAFFYQVYGLKLKSDLELPELVPIADQAVDFSISLGPVPEALSDSRAFGSWADYLDTSCLFRIDNIGRYLIEDGRSITVEPCGPSETDHGAAAALSDVRLYLLGSALAALLHQRGLLPLHVSAVLADSGVWAFTGPSGAGKSTVAGWLSQDAGLPLISDDVSVVSAQNNSIRLFPGPRKLKLWDDAVDFLKLEKRRLVQDLSNTPKFQLYLPDDTPGHQFGMTGLIMLERAEPGERAELIPVTGIDRFRCCCQAVYRHYMARWFRTKADYVRDVFQLSEAIQVYRLRRPWSLEQLGHEGNPLVDLLLTDKEEAVSR